jgi:glutathione S-transferase
MSAKLYSLALSHPSQAVRLMLELKGIDHEVKDLLPGFHPPQLRLAGFREAWGEREFQPVPRRIFRWSVTHSAELRRWMAKSIGMPAPGLTAAMNVPIARHFARKAGAGDERVRADVKNLPSIFDHVDALIAEGTLGGTDLNAADFQIGATARVFLGFEDLAPLLDGRPTKELALRVLPRYQGRVPRVLPAEWLAGAGLAGSRTAA